MPLRGRVVLLTGASRRIAIGAGVARRLVADGAAVLLHSWSPYDAEQPWGADPGGAEALVEELRSRGGRVEHVCADLANPDDPDRLVDAACRAFGHLDVVVANHARSGAQVLEELTVKEIDLSYAVNTRATLLLVQAFAAQHEGRRRRAQPRRPLEYPRRHRPTCGMADQRRSQLDHWPSHRLRRRLVRRRVSPRSIPQQIRPTQTAGHQQSRRKVAARSRRCTRWLGHPTRRCHFSRGRTRPRAGRTSRGRCARSHRTDHSRHDHASPPPARPRTVNSKLAILCALVAVLVGVQISVQA